MPPEPSRLQVLFGGTFDPVHNGHVGVARQARDTLRAEIRLMPAADPPHKSGTHASADQRADMLRLALAGERALHVDLRELHREGPSYTVDTLRALRDEVGPDAPWAILIGADSFRTLDSWDRWRELFELAHVVVARRPGSALDTALPLALAEVVRDRVVDDPRRLHQSGSGAICFLDQPLFAESATEVRQRIRAGEPWQHLVAPAVAAYILENGLYESYNPGGIPQHSEHQRP